MASSWARTYCENYALLVSTQENYQRGGTDRKAAALKLALTGATTLAGIANRIADLGSLGDDVQEPHDELVELLRETSDRYAVAHQRIEGMNADANAYEQVLADEVGSRGDDIEALFKDISERPKYAKAFTDDRVCQGLRYMMDD